jgi:hypothetical protein
VAWNQTSIDPLTRLGRTMRDWESKGLPFWEDRLADYTAKVRAADNSGRLARMLQQKEMAEMAVYVLKGTDR